MLARPVGLGDLGMVMVSEWFRRRVYPKEPGAQTWPGNANVTAGSLGTANAGGGAGHTNVQPTVVVNKLMRVL